MPMMGTMTRRYFDHQTAEIPRPQIKNLQKSSLQEHV